MSVGATDSKRTRAAETPSSNHGARHPPTATATPIDRVNGLPTAVTCRAAQGLRIQHPLPAVLDANGVLGRVNGCPTGGTVGVALPDHLTGGVSPAVQVRVIRSAGATFALFDHCQPTLVNLIHDPIFSSVLDALAVFCANWIETFPDALPMDSNPERYTGSAVPTATPPEAVDNDVLALHPNVLDVFACSSDRAPFVLRFGNTMRCWKSAVELVSYKSCDSYM